MSYDDWKCAQPEQDDCLDAEKCGKCGRVRPCAQYAQEVHGVLSYTLTHFVTLCSECADETYNDGEDDT